MTKLLVVVSPVYNSFPPRLSDVCALRTDATAVSKPQHMADSAHVRAGASFFHWQNTGAALQVLTTHSTSFLAPDVLEFSLNGKHVPVILQLRIYAMYGSTRTMLFVCLTLTAIEATLFGVLFGLQRPGLVGALSPISFRINQNLIITAGTRTCYMLQPLIIRQLASLSAPTATHYMPTGSCITGLSPSSSIAFCSA